MGPRKRARVAGPDPVEEECQKLQEGVKKQKAELTKVPEVKLVQNGEPKMQHLNEV